MDANSMMGVGSVLVVVAGLASFWFARRDSAVKVARAEAVIGEKVSHIEDAVARLVTKLDCMHNEHAAFAAEHATAMALVKRVEFLFDNILQEMREQSAKLAKFGGQLEGLQTRMGDHIERLNRISDGPGPTRKG